MACTSCCRRRWAQQRPLPLARPQTTDHRQARRQTTEDRQQTRMLAKVGDRSVVCPSVVCGLNRRLPLMTFELQLPLSAAGDLAGIGPKVQKVRGNFPEIPGSLAPRTPLVQQWRRGSAARDAVCQGASRRTAGRFPHRAGGHWQDRPRKATPGGGAQHLRCKATLPPACAGLWHGYLWSTVSPEGEAPAPASFVATASQHQRRIQPSRAESFRKLSTDFQDRCGDCCNPALHEVQTDRHSAPAGIVRYG